MCILQILQCSFPKNICKFWNGSQTGISSIYLLQYESVQISTVLGQTACPCILRSVPLGLGAVRLLAPDIWPMLGKALHCLANGILMHFVCRSHFQHNLADFMSGVGWESCWKRPANPPGNRRDMHLRTLVLAPCRRGRLADFKCRVPKSAGLGAIKEWQPASSQSSHHQPVCWVCCNKRSLKRSLKLFLPAANPIGSLTGGAAEWTGQASVRNPGWYHLSEAGPFG
jgi:hypothetical protein